MTLITALFRPVAMSKPDNAIIAKVLLFAEGFQNDEIGRRLCQLFTLCRELLSEQQHYDWGLRALKTVLSTAGKLLREEKRSDKKESDPNELNLAVRAVTINTNSKLTFEDSKQFDALLKKVFPEVSATDIANKIFEESIREICEKDGIYFSNELLRKCIELNEQLSQRIGVVICGPCCGKTLLWELLAKQKGQSQSVIKIHHNNPKATPREQLLGWMDPV